MLFITLQSSILCEAIVSTGRGCLVSVIQEYNSIHVYIYILYVCRTYTFCRLDLHDIVCFGCCNCQLNQQSIADLTHDFVDQLDATIEKTCACSDLEDKHVAIL